MTATTDTRGRGLLPGVLLGITLILMTALLLSRCERYSYVQHDAPPAKVLSNPFYAAGILLHQRGRPARTLHGNATLFPLPPTDTLLILDQARSGLDEGRASALRGWVADGGQLVVASGPAPDLSRDLSHTPSRNLASDDHHDPLLSPLGIVVARSDVAVTGDDPGPFADQLLGMEGLFHRFCLYAGEDRGSECERAMCGRRRTLYDTPVYPRDTTQPHDNTPRRVGFDARIDLRHADLLRVDHDDTPINGMTLSTAPVLTGVAGNAAGTQLIQLEYGAGRITVVTDLAPWHNTQLHYLDHAWMLDHLSAESRQVWFVQGLTLPPLHHWLWRTAAPLILTLALLLVLFIWRHLPRRGALLEDAGTRPGDFLDHLLASGRLLWRTGQQATLVAGLREQVRLRLRHHGDDEAAQVAAAARLSGLPAERIARALNEHPGTRPHGAAASESIKHDTFKHDTLLSDIETLHTLRRCL
ncbi:DUF4350 domain-containing protein [Alcanivorax sp. JB21]|uniref:DUF4350 domain-containing protein n=1 Tax=Alcanivorax limicola TaxID=2874102 RepID=UPI001CBD351D|nr:DUF4350 domain-containing protein [Alcanivorax limicola]MBZ2188451.1 DUF4350 domain-containing protein [Alcanivorax limicola]